MDFSKIKDGVISLSSFLVSHAAWLAVTIYCFMVALDQSHTDALRNSAFSIFSELNNLVTSKTLDDYSLRPLIAPLVFFFGIFVLHAHREILKNIGRYIPPEIVWHYMPGLRDISQENWANVLSHAPSTMSFDKLRTILEVRYKDSMEKRPSLSYSITFSMLKSLSVLNVALFIWPPNQERLLSLVLSLCFAAAACVVALLHIYHERNTSRWAIQDVFRQFMAEATQIKEDSDLQGNEQSGVSSKQWEQITQFVKAEANTKIVYLSWSVPFIGNLRVLKESLSNRRVNDDE